MDYQIYNYIAIIADCIMILLIKKVDLNFDGFKYLKECRNKIYQLKSTIFQLIHLLKNLIVANN